MTAPLIPSTRTPSESILDLNGRQIYLANGYVAGIASLTLASTAETPVLYLKNPSTSGISLYSYLTRVGCLTASNSIIFNFYHTPTSSVNGTAVAPVNLLVGGKASVITPFKSPTVSVNGIFMQSLQVSFGQNSFTDVLSILRPGKNMLVTAIASAGATDLSIASAWNEF